MSSIIAAKSRKSKATNKTATPSTAGAKSAAAAAATTDATQTIILRGLTLLTRIGVDAAERCIKQKIVIDLDLTPMQKPVDDNTPAVDYRAVVCALREFADKNNARLLETFAENCAALIINQFAVAGLRLFCRKPKPFADLAEAGIEVIRIAPRTTK